MNTVLTSLCAEFNKRGIQGDLSDLVRGRYKDPHFTLYINQFFLMQQGLDEIFTKIGTYSPTVPDGAPDVLRARGEGGEWWTRNFDALKAELNEKFLSLEFQID